MTLLILSAFAAGFVDSIVGGGGLIQLPALFVFLPPDLAGVIPAVMGTNKFASICGTAVATMVVSMAMRAIASMRATRTGARWSLGRGTAAPVSSGAGRLIVAPRWATQVSAVR